MNSLKYACMVIFVAFSRSKEALSEPVPSIQFQNNFIVQNDNGSFTVLLPASMNLISETGINCSSSVNFDNLILEIVKDGMQVTNSTSFLTPATAKVPTTIKSSGKYTCRLIIEKDFPASNEKFHYVNEINVNLLVLTERDLPVCLKSISQFGLHYEDFSVWCLVPQDHYITEEMLPDDCHIERMGERFAMASCSLSDEIQDLHCPHSSEQQDEDEKPTVHETNCGHIDIVGDLDLHIHPKEFSGDDEQLDFTCKSNPPSHPIRWSVFTDDGDILNPELWDKLLQPLSLNITIKQAYGTSTLTTLQTSDTKNKIYFVFCSTTREVDRLAVSRSVSDKFIFASTQFPAPVQATFAESLVYLIIIGLLLLLVLVLIVSLITRAIIPKLRSQRAESVDSSVPSLQPNPAYVGYDDITQQPENNAAYAECNAVGTRSPTYAEMQTNSINQLK